VSTTAAVPEVVELVTVAVVFVAGVCALAMKAVPPTTPRSAIAPAKRESVNLFFNIYSVLTAINVMLIRTSGSAGTTCSSALVASVEN
jgi:hypothetical protein